MDDKMEKFERLAEKRMTEAIKKIRLVSNLANRNNYNYTDEHVKKIVKTLEEELTMLKNKFKQETDEKNIKFRF